ncbi:hypothetical protein BRADI_3g22115v3 [Brachypodium distachyon]|uniref:Uncharacterized protein n=1 Tax=Brachypodium distachyon TaxID=15368 RepID=A0A2K2CYS3_BRADI|nr:hypothetical protein BRADI_3g22115v3 [Brachypodium distachyon]PNT67175.1 hypothetical protein BRADI_3g22115v3 [Brachypodium distachyon]
MPILQQMDDLARVFSGLTFVHVNRDANTLARITANYHLKLIRIASGLTTS